MIDEQILAALQKYELTIRKILFSGILDLRSGSITYHIDAEGNIRKIDTNKSVLVR